MASFVSPSPQSLSERELVFICNILNIDHRAMNKTDMIAFIERLFSTVAQNQNFLGQIPKIEIPYRKTLPIIFHWQQPPNSKTYISKEDLCVLAKHECINDKYFDWIDIGNDRMCNFLWSTIRMANINIYNALSIDHLDIFKDRVKGYSPRESLYTTFQYLDLQPRKNDMKIKALKYFFDALNLIPEHKSNEVNKIKDSWNLCAMNNDMLKWLGDISSADCMKKCNWAWEYICKKHKISSTPWFINNDNKKDLYNGIITAFDLSLCNNDAREVLKRDIQRAWTQKDYRDKNNGKKAVNVVLPENSIKMLDSICIKTDRRKNEVITRLIKEEYEKISK